MMFTCVYIIFIFYHMIVGMCLYTFCIFSYDFQMCVDMILKKCVDDLHVFKCFSYVFWNDCHMLFIWLSCLYMMLMCIFVFKWFSYVYMIVMCVYIFHFYYFQMCWYDFHVMLYYCHMFVYEWFSYVVYMLSIILFYRNRNFMCFLMIFKCLYLLFVCAYTSFMWVYMMFICCLNDCHMFNMIFMCFQQNRICFIWFLVCLYCFHWSLRDF